MLLDNTDISVYNPGSNPKTGRTNTTTKWREATSESLGRTEKVIGSSLKEKGSCGHREGKTPGSLHWEEESPKYLVLKTRGAEFCEFIQATGLGVWS